MPVAKADSQWGRRNRHFKMAATIKTDVPIPGQLNYANLSTSITFCTLIVWDLLSSNLPGAKADSQRVAVFDISKWPPPKNTYLFSYS